VSAAEQLADVQLTRQEAERLLDDAVRQAEALDATMGRLYHGGAAAALGYGSGAKGWAALCKDRLRHLEWLHIKPGPRRLDAVRDLRREELSTRAIGDVLGISAASVTTDLAQCRARGDQLPDNVRSLDDRRRSATQTPRPAAAPPAPLVPAELTLTELMRTVLEHVAGCGAAGASLYDVADALRWREGRVSSLLHRLERAQLVRRVDGRRGTIRPYVATLPTA
jgi:hypothetical protein